MKRNMKSNAVFNMIKTVFQIIFPLITFPYISRVLHAENVGKVNYANAIYSYMALLASLSISTYAIRTCVIYRDEKDKLSKVASEIFSINVVSTLISYVITGFILFFSHSFDSKILIGIYSINMIFTTLGADWINNVEEDFKYISIRTVVFQFLSLVLMFIFVKKSSDYYKYAIISVIATSGANLVNVFYRRRFCKIKFTLKMDTKRHLPPILKFFAQVVTQQIYVNSDVLMLEWLSTNMQVGLYSTASKIYNIINTLIASIFSVMLPNASRLWEMEEYDEYNSLLRKVLLLLCMIGLPCFIGLFFLSNDIIVLIAGNEYSAASGSLKIFAVCLLFSYIHGFIGNLIIIPEGDYNIGVISAIISSMVNVILNIFLIPKWGFNAAAFTTLIAEVISCIIQATRINSNIKIKNVWKNILNYILGCIIIYLFIFIMNKLISDLYLRIFTIIIGSVIFYFFTLYLLKDEIVINTFESVKNRYFVK